MGHSLCTETKGRREERAGPQGERGERGGWKRGEGPLRVSFQDGFYGVTSNADLPHPRPLHPPPPSAPSLHPSIRLSTRPSLLFLTIVYGQVDSNWLFFHETDFSTLCRSPPHPTGRGPFCCPLRSERI